MSWQRSFWFRVPLTKQLKRDKAGLGEATINNAVTKAASNAMSRFTVDNYAAFFNCTPVGRASDSMMAPT